MCGLYTNTNPFYTRDLSILRSWYPQGSEQSPMDSEGKLYCIRLQEANYIVENKDNCVCNFNSLWGKSKFKNLWTLIHSWRILSLNLRIHRNWFQNYSPRPLQNINLPARVQNVRKVPSVLTLSPQKPFNMSTFWHFPGRRDSRSVVACVSLSHPSSVNPHVLLEPRQCLPIPCKSS